MPRLRDGSAADPVGVSHPDVPVLLHQDLRCRQRLDVPHPDTTGRRVDPPAPDSGRRRSGGTRRHGVRRRGHAGGVCRARVLVGGADESRARAGRSQREPTAGAIVGGRAFREGRSGRKARSGSGRGASATPPVTIPGGARSETPHVPRARGTPRHPFRRERCRWCSRRRSNPRPKRTFSCGRS